VNETLFLRVFTGKTGGKRQIKGNVNMKTAKYTAITGKGKW